MRRTILAGIAVLALMVPSMFAAEQLVLTGGAATCTIDVSDTGVVTPSGTCGTLTIQYNPGTGPTLGDGQLQVTGTLGGFHVSDTANGGGVTIRPDLQDLNTVTVHSTGTGTFSASFTDTNYTDVAPKFEIAVSTVDNNNGPVSFAGLIGPNTIPGTNLIGAFTLGPCASCANSGIFNNPLYPTTPYSLTANQVITFTRSGTIQANYSISAVPEPAAISLMGGALLFACAKLRRRVRQA